MIERSISFLHIYQIPTTKSDNPAKIKIVIPAKAGIQCLRTNYYKEFLNLGGTYLVMGA
jgi:hypothetical protein